MLFTFTVTEEERGTVLLSMGIVLGPVKLKLKDLLANHHHRDMKVIRLQSGNVQSSRCGR